MNHGHNCSCIYFRFSCKHNGLNHECTCVSIHPKYCLCTSENNHICYCSIDSKLCRLVETKNSIRSHRCICFDHPKDCKHRHVTHYCICRIFGAKQCKNLTDYHLCCCDKEQEDIMNCKHKIHHQCICIQNNYRGCRNHLKIWNLWILWNGKKNNDYHLFFCSWIPEELLFEIVVNHLFHNSYNH